MNNEKTKKTLIALSCISTICLAPVIISTIPQYCSNYTLKSEQEIIANKLSELLYNPIIISSNLTASEALYTNNYETVVSLILNKIKDDLANTKFNINGNSYTSIQIIKNLHIVLPTNITYDEYESGTLNNVRIQYITNKSTININPINAIGYTVKGFFIPESSNISKTIADKLSLNIKNPIQINDSLNANQAIQANNINTTINKIKDVIRNDLNNEDLTIYNNVSVPIDQILKNLHITFPNSISSSELNDGNINNVSLTYENNDNIASIIPSNSQKNFIIQGFSIPDSKQIQEQNNNIVNELNKLIKNPITLANGFGLTAAQSVSSDANKQILFNAIKEVIKNELGTNFTINSISYETSEILQNITINVPNSVTTSQNNNQTIPNVTLSYKNIELKNSNGINYTVTNLAKVTNQNTNQATQNEKIAQQLSQIIKNPIQLLKGYAYSAQQSLSSSNYILLFKKAIIAAIENYITVNDIVVDGISYSKNTILNNIDVLTLLQGVTYSQNEQVEANNIIALYYGQPLGSSSIDSSISKPIYNSSSTNSWDVTGFNIQNINNTNWQSVNNNITTQLSSMITNPIVINGAYTAKQYVSSYPNELQELISNKVCSEVSTFYEDGLKITPQELKQFLEVELPNSNDVTETENDNAELNNVNLIYDYPQNSENDAANIIPSGASAYTIKGFLTPQQIQNKAIANYLSSIIPNPIVLPYNSSENEDIANLGNNATFPFPDGYENGYNNFTGEPEYDSSASAFSAFKNEIINIISNQITTQNIEINGISYSKQTILQNIQIKLIIKGVTFNQILSGNVDNMIALFYSNNNSYETPIYNSLSKNSWNITGFYSSTSVDNQFFSATANWWYGDNFISNKLASITEKFYIDTSYTAEQYYEEFQNVINDTSYNKNLIDTIDNLITNSFYEQISNDGEIIVNGIMLNYEEIKNLNIGNFYWFDNSPSNPTYKNNSLIGNIRFTCTDPISNNPMWIIFWQAEVIFSN